MRQGSLARPTPAVSSLRRMEASPSSSCVEAIVLFVVSAATRDFVEQFAYLDCVFLDQVVHPMAAKITDMPGEPIYDAPCAPMLALIPISPGRCHIGFSEIGVGGLPPSFSHASLARS